LLLDEFDRNRAPLQIVEIEKALWRRIQKNADQLVRQVHRVLDAPVQTHAADRIVDMRRIAGEQHAAVAEAFGDALMRHIKEGCDARFRKARAKERMT
jgi:hypothetical protein